VSVAEHEVHRADELLVEHLAGVRVVERGHEGYLHALDCVAVHGLRDVGVEHADHLDPLVRDGAGVHGLILVVLERELAGGLELTVERRRSAVEGKAERERNRHEGRRHAQLVLELVLPRAPQEALHLRDARV
jgi:hypothetical protein